MRISFILIIACALIGGISLETQAQYYPYGPNPDVPVFQKPLYPGGPSVPINSNVPIVPVFQQRMYPGGPLVPGPPAMPEPTRRSWYKYPPYYAPTIVVQPSQEVIRQNDEINDRYRSDYIDHPEDVLDNPEYYTPSQEHDSGPKLSLDDKKVVKFANSLQDDGSWSDIKYDNNLKNSWAAITHLSRLYVMARELKNPKSAVHEDKNLKDKCLLGLDFWLDSDLHHSNLAYETLKGEKQFIPILTLLREDMSPAQIDKACKRLEYTYNRAVAEAGDKPLEGAALTWIVNNTRMRGLLHNDPKLIALSSEMLSEGLSGNGKGAIKSDGSYHNSTNLLSSHGEGREFLSEASAHAKNLQGTDFALKQDNIRVLSDMLLKGNQWMSRGNTTDIAASGRSGSLPDRDAEYLADIANRMGEIDPERKTEYEKLIARFKDPEAKPLTGNKMFYKSDYMAHHRPDFFCSVRMHSDRTPEHEIQSGLDLQNFFLSLGTTPIVRHGNEYRNILPVCSWGKIPGTTLAQVPPDVFIDLKEEIKLAGGGSFVGGLSDGTYGFTAYDFSWNRLKGRKATFFFDEGFMALGAGIEGNAADFQIVTTLNQARLFGKVYAAARDPEDATKSNMYEMQRGPHLLPRCTWVWHDGISYIFPKPTDAAIFNDEAKGNWFSLNEGLSKDEIKEDLFTLCIPHGTSPEKADYEYAVIIGKDASKIPGIVKDFTAYFQTVSNTPEIQAVWYPEGKIGCAALYVKGVLTFKDGLSLEADQPCLVMVKEKQDGMSISLADPTQELKSVQLRITRNLRGPGVQALDSRTSTNIVFELPQGELAGSTVTNEYE